jgi:hypothetical protein
MEDIYSPHESDILDDAEERSDLPICAIYASSPKPQKSSSNFAAVSGSLPSFLTSSPEIMMVLVSSSSAHTASVSAFGYCRAIDGFSGVNRSPSISLAPVGISTLSRTGAIKIVRTETMLHWFFFSGWLTVVRGLFQDCIPSQISTRNKHDEGYNHDKEV